METKLQEQLLRYQQEGFSGQLKRKSPLAELCPPDDHGPNSFDRDHFEHFRTLHKKRRSN